MSDAPDTNAEFWKSAEQVAHWVTSAEERERQYAHPRTLISELLPFAPDEPFTVLDLGAGTGAAARAVLSRFPAARAILADFSPQMMEHGHQAMAAYAGRYSYVEFDLAAGLWPDAIPAAVDAVISSMCVHHLTDDRKRQLFKEILGRLIPGGWYLNYDPVAAADPGVDAAWLRVADQRDPEFAYRRIHRTPEQQARYENHVRYIIPLAPQVGFLREAGFEAVDVYWKELEEVVYGGRRPA
ncbi:MAG: class I SAM-dependent methyltransferase [Streptosporangiaceae bacterium]